MKEIKMPIYGYDEKDYIVNGKPEGTEYIYDWEEMANELENRICKILNKDVSITISEKF